MLPVPVRECLDPH